MTVIRVRGVLALRKIAKYLTLQSSVINYVIKRPWCAFQLWVNNWRGALGTNLRITSVLSVMPTDNPLLLGPAYFSVRSTQTLWHN